MIDKHTLRANALMAMQSSAALDWAAVVIRSQRAKATEDANLRAEYTQALGLIELEIEDTMSKCHEALTAYYAK